MRVDVDRLSGKLAERRMTKEELATGLDMDASTFYRKIKADGLAFTVGQMHKIVDVLGLTRDEACQIFFSNNSQ